jgi:hypothetical protein
MTSIVSWCSGACYPLSRSPERLIGPSPTGSLLDVKWKPSRSSLSRRLTKIGSPSEEPSRRRRMHRAVRTPSTRCRFPAERWRGHRPCTCEGATSGRPGTRGVNQSTALQSLRHLSRSVDSLTPHIPCRWPILYRAPVLGGMRVCGTGLARPLVDGRSTRPHSLLVGITPRARAPPGLTAPRVVFRNTTC